MPSPNKTRKSPGSPKRTNRSRRSSPVRAASPKNLNRTMEFDALEGYHVPNLSLRKGIWENFPVTLTELYDGNGTQRYAVRWHVKNLRDWKKHNPESWDEAMDYEDWQIIRLMHSLKEHSRQYNIEPARDASMICVIAMRHR